MAAQTRFVNWSQSNACAFTDIATPRSIAEARRVMARTLANGQRIVALGSGHSWAPSVCNGGRYRGQAPPLASAHAPQFAPRATPSAVALATTGLHGVVAYDGATHHVTCLAGTRNGELLQWLASERGRTLHTHPIDWYITVGGAVATASHGARLRAGTISDSVAAVQPLLGTLITDGDEREAEVHGRSHSTLGGWACSLGRLGPVAAVTLRTRPMPRAVVRVQSYATDVDVLLARLARVLFSAASVHDQDRADDKEPPDALAVRLGDHLYVWWHPDTGRCDIEQVFEDRAPSHDFALGDDGTARAETRGSLLDFVLGPGAGAGPGPASGPSGAVREPPPSQPYVEAEYAVRMERLAEAVHVVREWIADEAPALVAPVFLRFVGYDTLPWLSPVQAHLSAPPRSGHHVYVLVDMDARSAFAPALARLEREMWRRVRGMPHLGKYNVASDAVLLRRYGESAARFFTLEAQVRRVQRVDATAVMRAQSGDRARPRAAT